MSAKASKVAPKPQGLRFRREDALMLLHVLGGHLGPRCQWCNRPRFGRTGETKVYWALCSSCQRRVDYTVGRAVYMASDSETWGSFVSRMWDSYASMVDERRAEQTAALIRADRMDFDGFMEEWERAQEAVSAGNNEVQTSLAVELARTVDWAAEEERAAEEASEA